MGVKLEAKAPAGETGPERTKPHPTAPSAMSHTTNDIGDKFISGGLASLAYENPGGYESVKKAAAPTLGPGGMAAWQSEVDRRVAKAQAKPPNPWSRKNVPAELMSQVLLTRLAKPLNMDPSKIDVVAKEGYEVKGSPATFNNDTIYINPGQVDPSSGTGREVITHEAVHFVQSKNQTKKDMASAEAEAANIARLDALNQPLPKPQMGLPASEPATYTPYGAGPPDVVTLNLGGAELKIPTPGTIERAITVPVPGSPVPGLVLTSANLKFDNQWSLESGELTGSIVTPWLKANGLRLEVKKGGGVQMEVTAADLTVGGVAAGKMDVIITKEGVTGDSKLEFGDITLGMGLAIEGGYVEFHHTPSMEIKGLGALTGTAEGLGKFTLAAEFEGPVVTGRLGVTVSETVDLGAGVQMSQAAVSAEFKQGGFDLEGGAHVKVSDWAEGDLAAKYTYPGGPWTVKGTVNQMGGERAFGEMTVSNATLGVKVSDGSLEEVKGQGHFVVPNFEGNFGGTYDVGGDAFTGGGSVTMTEPIDMGDGTLLKAVDGDLRVEGNTLVETKGKLKAEFSYEDQPTFDAELEGNYLFQEKQFNGEGKFVTMRDVTLGPPDQYHAVVSAGSEATVKAAGNLIEKADAQWKFVLNDTAGEVAAGEAAVEYDGQKFKGAGKFSVTSEIGFPERGAGPAMVLPGTTLDIEFQDSLISTIAITAGSAYVKSSSGQGEIQGDGVGALTPDVHLESLEGFANQQSPFKVVNDNIELTAQGVTLKVKDDLLVESKGQASLAVNAVGGLTGKADFDWTNDKGGDEYVFNGILDYQLSDDIGGEVDLLLEGGVLSVEGTAIDGTEKLDELAELVRRVIEVASVGMMAAPFSLEMVPTFLAYRIWVLEDLDSVNMQTVLRELWAQIQAGFAFLLEFLPQWMVDSWDWVQAGAPNVLEDLGDWLAENLKSLGQTAIDWLLDMGDWGGRVIRSAGPWAMEAAGWILDAISDKGEAVASAAEAGWDWLSE